MLRYPDNICSVDNIVEARFLNGSYDRVVTPELCDGNHAEAIGGWRGRRIWLRLFRSLVFIIGKVHTFNNFFGGRGGCSAMRLLLLS